ncbi:hypothetical protein MBM_04972 [Drepanopeziza brunnea f. sp. 'multigermtubi' MB_m1]|uniref:Uncharacterized protein n=1 Tax=Marssonina brunnea f. sp. multigermtubi (strain MB_m1) TaxID=1072389 RepID=K1X772_MARBU|nr:uncharacterized protein MBM_04972 [Drepanopeziza brunnea f. sp. 'multigermtubi' MB_m1]EKD16503.1 hypothetical protein MBM_04972 [Drepanopeziza brunnea f. sp. 'multigermtubi' MB_m1]
MTQELYRLSTRVPQSAQRQVFRERSRNEYGDALSIKFAERRFETAESPWTLKGRAEQEDDDEMMWAWAGKEGGLDFPAWAVQGYGCWSPAEMRVEVKSWPGWQVAVE